uniref:Platelet glycoprotein 4 n=1 Tax=Myripristis murdjan TaxID=586833 RepID=A0A668A822_9TELE
MGRCNRRCGLIAGAVFGAVVAILGGVLIPVGDSIIEGTVKKEAVIEPGTAAYDNWASAEAVVYRQFWLFDVKNPLEVLNNGTKPVVTERGPYTYRTRYLPKENITAHSNHTIAFVLPAGAIFEPSLSVGPEEDQVTSLNLAVAVSECHPAVRLLEGLIRSSNSSLFQRRTIKEILWGYPDPILKRTVGVFVPYNGTYDGYYNVYTGKDDISKVGLIDRWQGERTVDYWNNTYCDMINGTDASSFPPFLDKKKPLYFFSSDICRSVSATFEKSKDLKGIEVYRYVLPTLTLASPKENPDNQCFCTDPVVTKDCALAGVLDVSSCRDGAPIYISLPHFLHGSAYLIEDVLGLNPSEEHHATYLDVEPVRTYNLPSLKCNLSSQRGHKVKDYTIFPVVWLNETAVVDDKTADMFKKELIYPIQLLHVIQQALLGVGLAIFFLCLIAYCVVRRKENNGKLV